MDEQNQNNNLKELWQEFNLPEKTEVRREEEGGPVSHHRRKKLLVYTTATLFGLIVSFFFIYFLVLEDSPIKSLGDIKSETVSPSATGTPTTTPTEIIDSKIDKDIAYLEDNDLKIINANGQQVIEMPDDKFSGDVTAYEWKNKTVITYSRCSFTESSCKIFNVNTIDSSIATVVEIPDSNIVALKWSNDEKKLFYHLNNKKDGNYYTYIFEKKPTQIKKWTRPIGRGLALNDMVGFDFSDDGKNLLFTNTINSQEENFITLFDLAGKELAKISESATFGFFIDGANYSYVQLGTLKTSKGEEPLIESFKGLNPKVSPDNAKILYWIYDDKVNKKGAVNDNTYMYNFITKKETFIEEDFIHPDWLTVNNVIGLVIEKQSGLFNYKVNGLATLQADGKNFRMLAPGKIDSFRISK